MFPFWLELSEVLEPLAVMAVALLTWLFQSLSLRGG
jgi:hypothetical protein